MKYFSIAWGIVIAGLLAVFAFMLVRNTWPQKVKDSIITINVVETEGKTTGDEVQISKSVLKDTLQQSAYAARREAQIEYDRNFSTLLTILTIFGIAWPLMVAFAQYKFNERELNKIQDTDAKANGSLAKADAAFNKASKASGDATAALGNANKALTKANKALDENRMTDDIIKTFFESFKKSNSLSWQEQAGIYAQLELALKQSGVGNKSLYNLLKLMSLHCQYEGVRFGNSYVATPENIINWDKTISSISPENPATDCSELNMNVAYMIKLEIENLLENNHEPQIRGQLKELGRKLNNIYKTYKKLVLNEESIDI